MQLTGLRRLVRPLLAGAVVATTLAVPAQVEAALPVGVDFTVREALPLGTPGVITASDVPSCASGTVDTPTVRVIELRRRTIFFGQKVVDCGAGNTFTMLFSAAAAPCDSTDRGRWLLVSGTGDFEDARGRGRLIGTYFTAPGAPGDFCDNDGIDDRYTGRIRLAD